jgi:hypothetical protein
MASEAGIQYYVLRPSFDVLGLGQYLHKPELRDKLRAHPGPRRVLMADVDVKSAAELERFSGTSVSRLFGIERGEPDAGLFADVLELGANTRYTAPAPHEGGGQIVLVLQGALVHNGNELGPRSAIALTADEEAVSFSAGSGGLQALILQYPRRSEANRA